MKYNSFPLKIEINGQIAYIQESCDLPVGKAFTILEMQTRIPEPTKYERFLVGYGANKLLKEHALTDYGIWEVYGEDPNCDFNGPHHEPFLGVFEGTLENVIKHAVELPRFWQWGAGGHIKKAKQNQVTKV